MLNIKVNIQVLKVNRLLITLFKPVFRGKGIQGSEMSIFFKHFCPYSKLRTANGPIAWRKQTQPYNKTEYSSLILVCRKLKNGIKYKIKSSSCTRSHANIRINIKMTIDLANILVINCPLRTLEMASQRIKIWEEHASRSPLAALPFSTRLIPLQL